MSSHGSMPLHTVWKPQPHGLVVDWLGLMEPARGESCPSGPRRGPAAHGEDRVPSPDHRSFHISTTSRTRGRKRRPVGSIPPSTVWKHQPRWLNADWLGLMEPACGGSCLSGQRRVPAATGEDEVLSRDQHPFHISKRPTTQGQKLSSHGSIPPSTVWKHQPRWLIADWLGLMEPARGGSCLSGQR